VTVPPARRRAILVVLALVIAACLGTAAVDFVVRATDDEEAAASVSKEREELLRISREFATRFNTYDPSMLDDEGHLPDYAAVEDLMTPKFGGVFADNVGYAEQTVAQLGVASVGTVYAVGVASQDGDSAEVLVAGTIELSYPYPDEEQEGEGDSADDSETDELAGDEDRVSTGAQRFRYQVSLVKIDGEWLVDDLDDIDDGLPPFSQPGIPEDGQTTPGASPSAPITTPPAEAPTTEQSEEGER
jgi:Mce-associated membrane protein